VVVEFDDLQAGLVAIRMDVVVPQLQLPGCEDRALVPELLHRLVINPIAARGEENPRQFPMMKARIEGLEPMQLLTHGLGDAMSSASGDDLHVGGQ
jgi:hypothetical protein